MPNIENLRKQAKRVVRWHRDGHYPVAELIRSHLPKFADLPDPDVLAAPFGLADAQELVARQNGFSSWAALLQGATQMSDSTTQPPIDSAFVRAEAQLLVTDLPRSLVFYTEQLGFATQFAYGEPPFYAQVARGGAHLNLRLVPELPLDPALARREIYLAVTICVTSIKELFLDYQSRGVEFAQPLRTEPWGARTFIITDPDANLILFAA